MNDWKNTGVLDLGCGNRKRPNSVGIDKNELCKPDIVHDLNVFPYPFPDRTFHEIYLDNVLEHLDNVIGVMEEVFRISTPNGRVVVISPYFRAHWAFIDPTHRHFFTVHSFTYFNPDHPMARRFPYSCARFMTEKVIFNESIKCNPITTILKPFANRWPAVYETYVSHLWPMDDITFYLRAVK